jgi:ferredoxin--NADP+ reductase
MPKAPSKDLDPGPTLPSVKMNLATPKRAGTARVVANDRCSAPKASGFVRHFAIDVSGTPLAGNFRVGQSFGILPPGVDERGKPHKVRLYSICSPSDGEDGEGNVVATPVKRLIDEHHDDHSLFLGLSSNYMCDLHPGDEVKITGPSGKRFLLPSDPDAHDYVFFATGTGIAPYRGMMRELLARNAQTSITLIMGSPYTTDLLYDDEIRDLATAHPNVSYLTAISRETQADGHGRMYVGDRLAANIDELMPLLCSERGLIYVCGLEGMEVGIFQQLAKLLPAKWLQRYLQVGSDAPRDVDRWDRRILRRHVKHTGCVFLEVY